MLGCEINILALSNKKKKKIDYIEVDLWSIVKINEWKE